jgi:hypothetical protein
MVHRLRQPATIPHKSESMNSFLDATALRRSAYEGSQGATVGYSAGAGSWGALDEVVRRCMEPGRCDGWSAGEGTRGWW